MNFLFFYCFVGDLVVFLVYLIFLKFWRKFNDDGILSGSFEGGWWGKWDKMEIFKSIGFFGSESIRVWNIICVNLKYNFEIDFEVVNLMNCEDGENRIFEIDIELWFDIIMKLLMGFWYY